MTDKVEYYFENYAYAKQELKVLEFQLENYKPITVDEVIQSLTFEHNDNECVTQTKTNIRTENLALTFREKTAAENKEYLDSIQTRYLILKNDLDFFDVALEMMNDNLKQFTHDMVISGLGWDELANNYTISRSTVSNWRKKALEELRLVYQFAQKSTEW